MKLFLTFGEDKEVVDWYQEIKDLPSHMRYKGQSWEFVMYDRHHYYDWVCHFSRSIDYSGYFPSFEGFFGNRKENCECGAKHTSFEQFHMQFCPMWKDIMNGK